MLLCSKPGAGFLAEEEVRMSPRQQAVTRQAFGSGRWFPGGRKQLDETVRACMDEAEVPPIDGRLVGAIAPHAGYVYSGKVAGYTFRALRDNAEAVGGPDVVVILGFGHSAGFQGGALMEGAALETPLGPARLDGGAAAILCEGSSRIRMDYEPHAGEHSAENLVPFVQVALPGVPLVIGLMGDHESRTRDELVLGLGRLAAERRVVVVASTDLLHDPDHELVSRTDRATLARVAALDGEGLLVSWDYSSQVCCGISPVLSVLAFARAAGCTEGLVLHYRNSGDDFPEGRGNWVVGYGAAVFPVPV